MLEDPASLQFILDTVYQLGGAPKNMEHVKQEAFSSGEPNTGGSLYETAPSCVLSPVQKKLVREAKGLRERRVGWRGGRRGCKHWLSTTPSGESL